MTFQTILFEMDGGVARLTLNRPDKLNSFNTQMHGEIQQVLAGLPQSGARVLVLTGAGRGFCAGQDLGDRAVAPGSQGVDLGESIAKYYNPLILALHNLPMPVIAAVNGGGGRGGRQYRIGLRHGNRGALREFRSSLFEAGAGSGFRGHLDIAAPGGERARSGVDAVGQQAAGGASCSLGNDLAMRRGRRTHRHRGRIGQAIRQRADTRAGGDQSGDLRQLAPITD